MSPDFGKLLIILGIVFLVVGLILSSKFHIPWLGRLPGDIFIRRGNFQFYFPLVTSILLSILVTAIFYFFRK